MVAPRFRSRKNRRVGVKTPGGRYVIHYENKTYGKPQCGQCGETLKGMSIGTSTTLRKLSKTQRRPERPYGGVLCSKCMRKVMVEKARKLVV